MKNNKGNVMLIVLAAVVAVLVVGYVIFVKNGKMTLTNQPVNNNNYQQIQGNSDLQKASSDLDSSDIGAMDTQLNQLSSDSSGF